MDRTIESQKRSAGQAPYELEMARGAIKEELDALMPGYKAVRDGADAPRMRAARKEGAKVAGGGLTVEKVRGIASGLTGKPLTVIRVERTEKVEVVPARLRVNVYERPIYGLPNRDGVVVAELPLFPIDKCMADNGFLADVAVKRQACLQLCARTLSSHHACKLHYGTHMNSE
jgi:hypothetical protein